MWLMLFRRALGFFMLTYLKTSYEGLDMCRGITYDTYIIMKVLIVCFGLILFFIPYRQGDC